MNAKLEKSLTPEEKAILGNIKTLLAQLDEEDVAEMDQPAVDQIQNASIQEDFPMKEEEEEVEKSGAPEETSEKAEQRLNVSDADIDRAIQILKACADKKQGVQKSAVLKSLHEKIEAQGKQIDELTEALGGLIEGFGFVQPKPKAPVQKSALQVLSGLVEKATKHQEAEGSLKDVMTQLFS